MAYATPVKPIVQAWVNLEPAKQRGTRGGLGQDTLSISQPEPVKAHYPCLSSLARSFANSDPLWKKAIQIKQSVEVRIPVDYTEYTIIKRGVS